MSDTEHPLSIRAAVYARMSTDHQEFSVDNQMEVIREYAAKRGYVIVREYIDEGKSGLSTQGRDAWRQMIADIKAGKADFAHILVLDVSRWGRFQDPDESAYYEVTCRKAGVQIHFCAESFVDDGSINSSLMKVIKRCDAAGYSQTLSAKVFRGACFLIRKGFKQGGPAGFGLRRKLIDQNGNHKFTLKTGEHKSIQTDRVILEPGPEEEVKIVQWMYDTFISQKANECQIADMLNAKGIRTDFGQPWTRATVHEVLTNEKYIGNNVYCRTSCKLKTKRVKNPPEEWVRVDGAFKGIVSKEQFLEVRKIIVARCRRFSEEQILTHLRRVLEKHGRLSGILINEDDEAPSSAAVAHRFGSLLAAYKLIGYTPEIDYRFMEVNRLLRERYPALVDEITERLRSLGATVLEKDKSSGILRVNDEMTVSIVLCKHLSTQAGASRWLIRLDEGLHPDVTIAARMDSTNQNILDYYILPAIDMTWENLRVAETNAIYLDAYRYDSLDFFFALMQRTPIE